MFQVGDMVKYRSDILEGPEWIGIVVETGHNGFNQWLKVKFFNDPAFSQRVAAASKFARVS
jgi:hypothetical protein